MDFKRKQIDLPAEITKAGERRIVDMPENLVEWLLACRKGSGPLLPINFRRKRWALCQEMNWENGLTIFSAIPMTLSSRQTPKGGASPQADGPQECPSCCIPITAMVLGSR